MSIYFIFRTPYGSYFKRLSKSSIKLILGGIEGLTFLYNSKVGAVSENNCIPYACGHFYL